MLQENDLKRNIWKIEKEKPKNKMFDLSLDLWSKRFKCNQGHLHELYHNGEILIGSKPEKMRSETLLHNSHHSRRNCRIQPLHWYGENVWSENDTISRARTLDQIYMIENTPEFKFANAKIYKIESESGVYIESMIGSLEKRFTEHKKGKGKFITSFKLLGDEAKNQSLKNAHVMIYATIAGSRERNNSIGRVCK